MGRSEPRSRAAACAAAMLATGSMAADAAGAIDPAKLPGIWRSEQSAMVGSSVSYYTFTAQHTCTQVAKGKLFGTTKWAAIECGWSLEGDTLTLTITGSPSDAGAVGKAQKYKVAELSDQALTISAGGQSQSCTRVAEVPAEFASHLPQAGTPGPKQPEAKDGK